jgi:photosystem II stability/assembly factor-like uncharacterized protein
LTNELLPVPTNTGPASTDNSPSEATMVVPTTAPPVQWTAPCNVVDAKVVPPDQPNTAPPATVTIPVKVPPLKATRHQSPTTPRLNPAAGIKPQHPTTRGIKHPNITATTAIASLDQQRRRSRANHPVSVGLEGVSCPNSTTCFAVTGFSAIGEDGGIVETLDGGSTWISVYSDGSGFLSAISCPSTSSGFVCYAAGSQGLLLHSSDRGATWTPQSTPVPSDWFLGITCVSATVCFAASKGGNVLEGGSAGWSLQFHVFVFLNSVSCWGRWTCHAVGNSGTALVTATGGIPIKTGDPNWTVQIPGTSNGLNGVSCPSVVRCFAVGQSGMILTTNSWGIDTADTVNVTNGDIGRTETTGLGTPQFVGRYLLIQPDDGLPLTRDEAAFIRDQGTPILLITSPNQNFRDGTADARNAIKAAQILGVPAGRAIFRDVEYNDPITASYIEAYYKEFTSTSRYVPAFYETSDTGHFAGEFCKAVAAQGAIATGTALWASTPEYQRYDPHQASMPAWAPTPPPCDNNTTTWQYKQAGHLGTGYPNVDVDEFLPSASKLLWVGP